jgi:hypothetical protein
MGATMRTDKSCRRASSVVTRIAAGASAICRVLREAKCGARPMTYRVRAGRRFSLIQGFVPLRAEKSNSCAFPSIAVQLSVYPAFILRLSCYLPVFSCSLPVISSDLKIPIV